MIAELWPLVVFNQESLAGFLGKPEINNRLMCYFCFPLVEPFTVISSEPADNSDLFATSPPALEKDVKSQAKKVLSLFEEEEEERLEDDDGIKNAQKGVDVVSVRMFLNTGKWYFHLCFSRQGFVYISIQMFRYSYLIFALQNWLFSSSSKSKTLGSKIMWSFKPCGLSPLFFSTLLQFACLVYAFRLRFNNNYLNPMFTSVFQVCVFIFLKSFQKPHY